MSYARILISECLLCGDKTSAVFKLESESKPVCLKCANAITRQNVQYLINGDMREMSAKTERSIRKAIAKLEHPYCVMDEFEEYPASTSLLAIDCPRCQNSVNLELKYLRDLLEATGG